MSRREDLATVLDAAQSWLDELGEHITPYYSPEEREEAQEVMDALDEAIQRTWATIGSGRCPMTVSETAPLPLKQRLGQCIKDVDHKDICQLEQLGTESENTK